MDWYILLVSINPKLGFYMCLKILRFIARTPVSHDISIRLGWCKFTSCLWERFFEDFGERYHVMQILSTSCGLIFWAISLRNFLPLSTSISFWSHAISAHESNNVESLDSNASRKSRPIFWKKKTTTTIFIIGINRLPV